MADQSEITKQCAEAKASLSRADKRMPQIRVQACVIGALEGHVVVNEVLKKTALGRRILIGAAAGCSIVVLSFEGINRVLYKTTEQERDHTCPAATTSGQSPTAKQVQNKRDRVSGR